MIAVFMADGFEEIEAITTIDILRRGGLKVITVSINETLKVNGAHGITIMADTTFHQWMGNDPYNELQAVILPGGMPGTKNLAAYKPLSELLLRVSGAKIIIGAICAAPMVLGGLNLLNGKKATCYPGFEEDLIGAEHSLDPVVVDLPYVTSRGAGTAFAFGLKLVELLKDKQTAEILSSGMIYQ